MRFTRPQLIVSLIPVFKNNPNNTYQYSVVLSSMLHLSSLSENNKKRFQIDFYAFADPTTYSLPESLDH